MYIPKDAHHTLIQAISLSLDNKNDAMTGLLGKLLRQVEEPEVRRVDSIEDYTPITYTDFIHTPYTHLVYRLTYFNEFTYDTTILTTVKRYANETGLEERLVLDDMKEAYDKVEIIGEVNEEVSYKYVTVHSKNTMVDYGTLLDICEKYKIHVEDMQTVIEDKMTIDDTFKFRYVGVDKI